MNSPNSYIVIKKIGNQLAIDLALSLNIEKEGRSYVVECMELELVDYGKTLREAIDNIGKMIILTITEAIHAEMLDKMLVHLGFEKDAPYLQFTDIYNISADKYVNCYPFVRTNISPHSYAGV